MGRVGAGVGVVGVGVYGIGLKSSIPNPQLSATPSCPNSGKIGYRVEAELETELGHELEMFETPYSAVSQQKFLTGTNTVESEPYAIRYLPGITVSMDLSS